MPVNGQRAAGFDGIKHPLRHVFRGIAEIEVHPQPWRGYCLRGQIVKYSLCDLHIRSFLINPAARDSGASPRGRLARVIRSRWSRLSLRSGPGLTGDLGPAPRHAERDPFRHSGLDPESRARPGISFLQRRQILRVQMIILLHEQQIRDEQNQANAQQVAPVP